MPKLSEDQIEKIVEAYRNSGNKTLASKSLGHSRNTVINYTRNLDKSQVSPISTPVSEDRVIPRRFKGHATHVLPNQWSKVCFTSCAHFPYQDDKAIGAMLNYVAANNFDLVILGGDQTDFYQISRFSKSPRRKLCTQDEIDSTSCYIKNVDSLGCDVIWMDGNHDHRMWLYIAEGGLHSLRALEIPSLFSLPERWSYAESQAHLSIGGFLFLHGDLQGRGASSDNVAKSMLSKLMTNCVFGHYHKFDSQHLTDGLGRKISAYSCGHLCDVDRADYIRSPNWQSGFCEVDFDHSNGSVEVRQHHIINGKFRANGRTWS